MKLDREDIQTLLKLVIEFWGFALMILHHVLVAFIKFSYYVSHFFAIACIYGNIIINYTNISTVNILIDSLMAIFMVTQGTTFQLTFLIHSVTWRSEILKNSYLHGIVYYSLFISAKNFLELFRGISDYEIENQFLTYM